MENVIFKKLKTLIEALTHSGCDTLDEDIFKEIKRICKSSQDNVLHVYSLILGELKKNNSQIRLAAFQICKELFKRSSLFRGNVVRDLHLIFDLTTESNSSKKLPPPKSSAENLKRITISTLKAWVEEFGETYKKLKVAYKYFEKCKQVDFETFEVGSGAEQILENERQRHLRMIGEEKIKRVLEDFNSNLPEIENTVTSLSNCISLLLPPAEEFFIPEHNLQKISVSNNISECNNEVGSSKENNSVIEDENKDDENCLWNNKSNLREYGISFNYNLTIALNLEELKIAKTKENSMIIENAKDCIRLINNRFIPMVKKWIKVHSIYGERNSCKIKNILDVKVKLENILKKYNSLNVNEGACIVNNESDSDDDYEFEEVKKEGYEDAVDFPEELMLDCLKKTSDAKSSVHADASTSKDSFKAVESVINIPTSSNSTRELDSKSLLKSVSLILDRKAKPLSVSPKSQFDIDFFLGENENLSVSRLNSCSRIDIKDKFWGSPGINSVCEIPNLDGVSALRTEVTAGLAVPKTRKKKRKSENKNLTHKKMKTSAEALKVLESKNLPGLIDVVKRQSSAYMRLSKKLFNRSLRKK